MNVETRDAVNAAIGVVSTVVFVALAVRVIAGPDMFRTLRMRGALAGETFCMRQASGWAHAADLATHAYNKARPVTV